MPESVHDRVRIAPPDPSSRGGRVPWVRAVLRLQQTMGNREVLRLLARHDAPPPAHDTPQPVVETTAPVPAPVVPVPSTWRQRLRAALRRGPPLLPGDPPPPAVVLLEDER